MRESGYLVVVLVTHHSLPSFSQADSQDQNGITLAQLFICFQIYRVAGTDLTVSADAGER